MSNPSRDSSYNLTPTISQPTTLQIQHSHAPQQQPNQNSHKVVRRLIITLVFLFVLISVISGIVWLIVHPLSPIFTVKSFSVSNFSLSANNSRILKGDYDVEFSIRNPNKRISLLIDHFDILLLYKTTLVSKAWMGAVHLGKMSQQYSSPRFSKDFASHLFNRRDFADIMNDWRSKREESFIVEMSIRIRFLSGKWLAKTSVMEVSCMKLVVDFLTKANKEVGKLKGGGKDCSVRYT